MHAIDYNLIVKELIRLAKKFYYLFYSPLVPAENSTILRRIRKTRLPLIRLEDG